MALSSQTPTGTMFVSVFSSGNESAPSAATDGQDLKELAGYFVIVSADSTRTLSGAGTLNAYIYSASPGPARWVRCAELDLTVPSAASGVRDWSWQAIELVAPRMARLMYIPSSVTVSAGGITIYQAGFTKHGRY